MQRCKWPSHLARWRHFLPVLFVLTLVGCGGGGSGTQPQNPTPPAPTPDFSLSVSPASLSIQSGDSAPVSLLASGTNGFTSQVTVQVSGLPTGVAVSPSSITLTPGTAQQVTLSADASTPASSASITFSGSSGSLAHSAELALTTIAPILSNTPPFRMRYVRTDAATLYCNLWNSHWIVYNPPTSRFFVTDPSGNRVFVLDASTETVIGSIVVPGAYSIDDTPDHTTLYVGTQIGDVYTIDPVAMQVTKRYPSAEIGPNGFLAYSALVMADGRLALLGGEGLEPTADGYYGFALWNPTDNSLSAYASTYGGGELGVPYQSVCGPMGNISVFTRTPDRNEVVMTSADSDGTICELNDATGMDNYLQIGGFIWHLVFSPDSNKMVFTAPAAMYNQVEVYDAHALTKLAQFSVLGDTTGSAALYVGPDSKTLYVPSPSIVYAYYISSGQLLGELPNIVVDPFSTSPEFETVGPSSGPHIQAIDGTGLLAGPMEEGVGFLDTTALNPAGVGTEFLNGYLNPSAGPASGGTQTSWLYYNDEVVAESRSRPTANITQKSSFTPAYGLGPNSLTDVYFGNQKASSVTVTPSQYNVQISVTTPPGAHGPADVYALTSDNGVQLLPEAFSYGPTVLEITPNAAAAEGGVGAVYGYGFGPTSSTTFPSDLQVTVGGKAATVTAYTGNPYGTATPPLPFQAFSYTIPPGTPGAKDVTVTTNAGSTTVHNGITYLPAIQQYSAGAAQLAQGIYDPHRDLYYFTDWSTIQVFSRTAGAWLTPISLPAAFGAQRLWGIALSPDGSQLAVADFAAQAIYVLDPDNPSTARKFSVPQPPTQVVSQPAGVAVADAGIVYFTVLTTGGTGYDVFFKLDTGSGQVTNYHVGTNSPLSDSYLRTVLSADGSIVYGNDDGEVFAVDTATDNVKNAQIEPACCYGDDDLAFSANRARLAATGYFYDPQLNAEAWDGLNIRETLGVMDIYGEKLSADGTLLFQPTSLGIDVLDARLGNLIERVALPVTLSPNYDALVSDGTDNVLVAITGNYGDGIAVIDLTSLPPAPLLPYAANFPAKTHRTLQNVSTSSNPHEVPVRSERKVPPKPTRRTVPHVTVQNILSRFPAISPKKN